MAWTSPRTWVAGEKPTAATFNVHVRDNLKAIGDPWISYTPTLTNWGLGNGTLTGSYLAAGKTIDVKVTLTMGTTTTFSGAPVISLPFTALSFNSSLNENLGTATLKDTSASTVQYSFAVHSTVSAVTVVTNTGAFVSPTVPWTWASTDIILLHFRYEAA